MNVIPVSGPLDGIFKGCPILDVRDVVGQPIIDENNNVIGVIGSIDKDKWYGHIKGVLDVKPKTPGFSIN